MERDAAGKHLAHHRDDVIGLEGHAQSRVAHATARGIGHFAVLQVIARSRKQIVIANVVVVHVADDHGFNLRRIDTNRLETFVGGLDQFALAFLGHYRVEAGVEHDGA